MSAPSDARQRGPVVLVVSPHAGQAAKGTQPAQLLAAAGVTVAEQVHVTDLDDSRPLGAKWRLQGYGAVVAAGGDGTLGSVATQVAGSGLPLGIVPLGTSNDTARALGIPLEPAAAAALVANGISTSIDVGAVTPLDRGRAALSKSAAPDGAAIFLHALTLGLNVAFARLATDVAQRKRWGALTYAASAFEALQKVEPVPITLHLADATDRPPTTITCEALQLAVINLPIFGGALKLRLPGAQVGNGELDIVVIEAVEAPRLKTLVEGLLAELARFSEHGDPADETTMKLPGVNRYRVRSAAIESPEPVQVTLDGELRAKTSLRVAVMSKALQVLLSPQAREALGLS